MSDHSQLITAALKARKRSIATYSNFQVGAALLTNEGEIISGANVESASYGLSCCAERVALFKALTDGHHIFQALAIASPGGVAPCGACRQLIIEYTKDTEILLIDSNSPENPKSTRISELLPDAFTGEDL